ncbi:parathyroid hormone/parathyroid hormone-related peptide receptor-like [Branchiostoma floridae]|uniref:Parathyroid hormone/parathyroid hormone-related peptide receptor-like n=1 Tax=Branchiostoma floridae TaxID=7739 RepID=A0A9J7N433_BRAFL|nr:parathyroid hormone/parathyroid hormone-related peptide receptor-like [Branchiostoma floridae]
MAGGRQRVAAALAFLVMSLQMDKTSTEIDQITLATLIKEQTFVCLKKLNETVRPNITGYCPGGPDYLGSCWPDAAPGQVVTLPCPEHIAFFNHSRTVQRACGNGTWSMNRLNLTEDYPSRCYIHKEPDMTDLYTVQIIYTVGYSLSLVSLTVAMGIIIRFRKLHCIRNYIHLHLFVSFILRAVFIFVKDAVLEHGAPWLFMIPWIAVRVTLQDKRCWEIKHLQYWWIYRGPILVSVLVNFVLFLNIVRILAVKLKQANRSREHSTQYKKLTRSTLVLIPLFGVHYIVFIGLPEDVTGQVKYVSYFFDTFMNSFQGMIVAVLYCFMNGEVQSELKRRWGLWRESRELGWERQSGLPTTTLSLVSRGSRDSPGNSPPRSPRVSKALPDSPVLIHYREYRVGDTTL